MTITEPVRRVLQFLVASPRPMTPAEVGRSFWPDKNQGVRRMMAGSVLRAAERRGLAERQRIECLDDETAAFVWRATLAARRILRAMAEATS